MLLRDFSIGSGSAFRSVTEFCEIAFDELDLLIRKFECDGVPEIALEFGFEFLPVNSSDFLGRGRLLRSRIVG